MHQQFLIFRVHPHFSTRVVVVVEVAAAPAEEFDGLAREAVGEFEDFFDVVRDDGDGGGLEGVLDGGGGGGGDEVAEGFDVRREIGDVLERREGLGLLGDWRRRRRRRRVCSLSATTRAFYHCTQTRHETKREKEP